MEFYNLDEFNEFNELERLGEDCVSNVDTIYEPLFKEVKIAIGLFKEAQDKQDNALINNKGIDKATKNLHEAQEHLFSFLETIQYEDK